MSFRVSIKDKYELWLAQMRAMPAMPNPRTTERQCRLCGEALIIRWGRRSEKWMVYHPLTWCEQRGATWYGATRAAAIEEFERAGNSGSLPSSAVREGSHSHVGRHLLAPKPVPPAQILAGWEVSGLDLEDVNKLLTEREEA